MAFGAAWSEKGCSGGEECADGCGSTGASAVADAEKDGEMRTDAETRKGRPDERLASGTVGEANDDVPVADEMQKAFYQIRVDPASEDPRRRRELLVAEAATQIRRHPTDPDSTRRPGRSHAAMGGGTRGAHGGGLAGSALRFRGVLVGVGE